MYKKIWGSTDKFSHTVLAHLFRPLFVDGTKICTNPADFILSAIPWNHVTTGKVGAMEMADVRDAVNAVIAAKIIARQWMQRPETGITV